jgi:hypothetical protein
VEHGREHLPGRPTRALLGPRAAGAARTPPAPGTAAHLLTRQLAAGNRAAAGALSQRGAALGRERLLQRANLIWSADDQPVIVDIDFGPRSGVQEDHATAVAAFGLAVLENLRGCSLQGAVIQLLLLANEITELPGYPDYRNKLLENQVDKLKTSLLALIDLAETKQLYVAGQLGSLIDDYLRVRNLVPGTKFKKKEAIRPADYKGGGVAEKLGKAKLGEALAMLAKNKAEPFANIEEVVGSALQLLHDYISTRTKQPSEAELVKIAAQHFHSIMQVSPLLNPFARQILDVWVNYMATSWASLVLDPKAFGAAVEKACAVHFPEAVVAEKPTTRQDVWGQNKHGYFPLGYDDSTVDIAPTDREGIEYKLYNPSRWTQDETIMLLNRAADQGLIAAARAIQYIIDHPAERDEMLNNLAITLVVLPSGKIYMRLRGG